MYYIKKNEGIKQDETTNDEKFNEGNNNTQESGTSSREYNTEELQRQRPRRQSGLPRAMGKSEVNLRNKWNR